MTPQTVFSLLSSIVFVISGVMYVRDVASKRVSPNIASFFIFTISNFSQLASLIVKDIWHVVPFMAVNGVVSLLILILCFRNKKYYFELVDKIGLAGSIIGLTLWYLTDDAAWNIYALSLVNIAAFVPIIVKSFKQPELETKLPWRINLLGSVLLVFAIPSAAFVQWVVPVRQLSCSLLVNMGLSWSKIRRKEN